MQLFAVDMVLNLITPYSNKEKVWVKDSRDIVMHYLSGWFAVDLISVFPFEVLAASSGTKYEPSMVFSPCSQLCVLQFRACLF